ncbi:MAG: aminomethyl-transferring glycine dehydrogenase subunit GcvPA [archaeon]
MDFIPNTKKDQDEMLKAIGARNTSELFCDIPGDLRLKRDLNLPAALSELDLKRRMANLAQKNRRALSFMGAGSYAHHIPSAVAHLIGRSEFYTAYTPYQPEISQGILQAIYEYQTMICRLTGMDVANASLYDGGTALAESVIMARRITGRSDIILSSAVHPHHRDVLKTYADANDMRITEGKYDKSGRMSIDQIKDNPAAAVVVQSPNFFGVIEQISELKTALSPGTLLIVLVLEPTSLGLIRAPSEADIVVGEGQALGNPVSFGGPYLGFMATKTEHMRQIPGRLVGITKDSEGKVGFILTLQAREQHIRRDRATSNICSNEALCALSATIYLALAGMGLRDVANHSMQKAHYALERLGQMGLEAEFSSCFYNEFVIRVPEAKKVCSRLIAEGIVPGLLLGHYYEELNNHILVCCTEMHTRKQIDKLAEAIKNAADI